MTITLAIIIFTCLLSIAAFNNNKLLSDLTFYPPAIASRNQYYRFISHGFIHGDFMHLAFNMLSLYFFGVALEKQVFSYPCIFGEKGKLFFILLYMGGLIAASLPDYFKHRDNYHYRSLGASGAVSGIIFGTIVLLPKLPINFLFIPIDIPGYIFGVIFLAASAYLDKRGGSNIGHSAHFWGAVFGIVFTVVTVSIAGHIDVWENFLRQLKASKPFLPYCDL